MSSRPRDVHSLIIRETAKLINPGGGENLCASPGGRMSGVCMRGGRRSIERVEGRRYGRPAPSEMAI